MNGCRLHGLYNNAENGDYWGFYHNIPRYKVTRQTPVYKVPTVTFIFLLVLLKSPYVKLSKISLS